MPALGNMDELDQISRERALTMDESLALEQAHRRDRSRQSRLTGRVFPYWAPKDIRALKVAISKRRKVADIARQLGRTERAVWKKICALRKAGKVGYISPPGSTGRYPRKGSMGSDGAEGYEVI